MPIAIEIERKAHEGARKLVADAAAVKADSDLLLINERGAFVEPEAARIIESEARSMGARVQVVWADSVREPNDVPAELLKRVSEVKTTIFNHRMANMLRFAPLAGDGRRINNFAVSRAILAAAADYQPSTSWAGLRDALNKKFSASRQWRIQCPKGTDISGKIAKAAPGAQAGSLPAAMPTFPLGSHRPLSALEANGRVVSRWIVTGGIHVFDPSSLVLDEDLTFIIERGRIIGFEGGDAGAKEKVRSFLENVGSSLGKDGLMVNSWHAGINSEIVPSCAPTDDVETWFLLEHGSPRLLHFHLVGEEVPGELSLPCQNPTITIDGELLWKKGVLVDSAVHAWSLAQ